MIEFFKRKRTWQAVGFTLLFVWGLEFLIWTLTTEGLWLIVHLVSSWPLIAWAVILFFWIDRKKGPDNYHVYFQGLSSEELARAEEYIKRNISRNSSENPAGTERESGVSSTWSTDQSTVRPEDGKA